MKAFLHRLDRRWRRLDYAPYVFAAVCGFVGAMLAGILLPRQRLDVRVLRVFDDAGYERARLGLDKESGDVQFVLADAKARSRIILNVSPDGYPILTLGSADGPEGVVSLGMTPHNNAPLLWFNTSEGNPIISLGVVQSGGYGLSLFGKGQEGVSLTILNEKTVLGFFDEGGVLRLQADLVRDRGACITIQDAERQVVWISGQCEDDTVDGKEEHLNP